MLKGVRAKLSDLIRSGATLEQAIAAKPTAEWDARYGDPTRMVNRGYAALSRARRASAAADGGPRATTMSLIPPVLALIGWTFVMWVWLYATRIPALRAARVDLVAVSRTGAKLELPPEVSRVADNYNHLHEQPTIFYALALAAQLANAVDGCSVALAWSYVGLRVVHSLVQATRNVIIVRFFVFAAASLVLLLLLANTTWLLLERP